LDQAVKLRTYIVEDNATIRENLIGTLEELASVEPVGFAETEEEGKVWLKERAGQWDLAIVDLFLRQGSGLGVLEACRERSPGQKMVVLSNYATPDIRMRGAQPGLIRRHGACLSMGEQAPLQCSHRLSLTPYRLKILQG
jgi:DNA-binding NarL/FixJ family response regulator